MLFSATFFDYLLQFRLFFVFFQKIYFFVSAFDRLADCRCFLFCGGKINISAGSLFSIEFWNNIAYNKRINIMQSRKGK